jgi:hypothetical protein
MRMENSHLCEFCKHNTGKDWEVKCKAFPDGVPDVILSQDFIHTVPYGDETVLFDEVENSDLLKPIPGGGYTQEYLDAKEGGYIIIY